MSIATAITAAQGRVANAYTAISNKGGTLPATQNLANMPTAINSIPSGGGSSELARYIVQNGTASARTTIPADGFSNITTIGNKALFYAFYQVSFDSNTALDMSSVTNINQDGMRSAFYQSSGIVSVDLSSLQTVGYNGLQEAFRQSYDLVSADLSSLQTIGDYGLDNIFDGDNNLVSVVLSSLQTVGRYGLVGAFYECDIRSISFDSLSYIGYNGFSEALAFNYNLSSVSFPALTSNSFEDDPDDASYTFEEMLDGCENVTVHFPSNLQSVIGNWSDVINGFGGTNTTILFDLPATE
jgi:hypothetical protein